MTLERTFPAVLMCGVLMASAFWSGCRQTPGERTNTHSPDEAQPTGSAPAAAAPDVTDSDTSIDVGQVRVTLSVPQRPITALERERFCVRADIDGIPVDLAKGHVTFDSDRPAGEQRYALVETADGCHSADVVLPAAASGGTRWFVTVEGIVDEQPVTARFQFDVTKAEAAQPQ